MVTDISIKETDVSIRYTDEAIERLEILKRYFIKEIERIIIERKYIPGDPFIEITASDLLYASKYIKVIQPIQRELRYTILYIYFMIGLVALVIGLFYNQLKGLLENPIQTMLVIIGFVMITASIILLRFTEIREKRYKKIKEEDMNG